MKFLIASLIASLFVLAPLSVFADPQPSGIPVTIITPTPTPSVLMVSSPAAPPEWAQSLLVNLQKLPVVGVVLTKVVMFAGIAGSILTALAAFLISVLASLSGAFSYAGFAAWSQKINDFKNGKIMYWIKYFSMFNAKSPEPAKGPEIQ